ncbi:MAG: hypothetical protein EOP47_00965 [Sphingobacteriaceae bacterium]|nr:MAG: hypothetical protein EOP47_00965 [Sphingobacteriaceae bacterium]
MKNICLILAIALIATACNSVGDKSEGAAADTLAVATTPRTPNPHALCFLRTEGTKNRDTTSIELVIKGDTVTGLMNWMPYEKDSRKGKLNGTIKNDTINALWSFMQEGMTDTISLKFTVLNNQLMQKPLKLNTTTGRQQTDDSAGYTLAYQTSDKIYK